LRNRELFSYTAICHICSFFNTYQSIELSLCDFCVALDALIFLYRFVTGMGMLAILCRVLLPLVDHHRVKLIFADAWAKNFPVSISQGTELLQHL